LKALAKTGSQPGGPKRSGTERFSERQAWATPAHILGPEAPTDFAALPGAPVVTGVQWNCTIDVFVVDRKGQLNVAWKTQAESFWRQFCYAQRARDEAASRRERT
jgi:hypothetical protein